MLTAHTYNVAGLKLVLLLPQEFDAGKELPNFKEFVLGEGANSMDLNANLNMSFNNDLPQED